MAQFSISISKRTAFRDSTQTFSNVYTYAGLGNNPNAAQATVLIDDLVTFEKTIHSSAVTFTYARCWSSGGTQAQNEMITEKALSGVGATGVVPALDRERAWLFQWKAGKDTKGRVVYLRKWYHPCGVFGTTGTPGTTVQDNTASIPQATRTTAEGLVDSISRMGIADDWGLVAESGRERDGANQLLDLGKPICHKYLEHRQFGDEWRG